MTGFLRPRGEATQPGSGGPEPGLPAFRGGVDKRRPVVFVAMRPGPSARFLLRTDIFRTLRDADVDLIVLAPVYDIDYMTEVVDDPEVPILPLYRKDERHRVKGLAGRVVVQRMRRLALDGRSNTGFRQKYDSSISGWAKKSPRVAGAADLIIRHGLWRSRLLRELVVRSAVKVVPPFHDEIFERYRPDLVVTTGLGYAYWDEGILQEAARRKIATAALVQNWDNPSTGGYRAVPLDLVVAWSERMRDQISELHDVPPDRIRVGGVPHWDPYLRPGAVPSREELCGEVGGDPGRRLLLHATHRPGTDVSSVELATVMAHLVAEGTFGDIQLVIRVHPMFTLPQHEEESKAFRDLANSHENVHVHYPPMVSRRYMDIDSRDTAILGGLLKHCDALVNVFSTTTLEGFLFDKPVVMAGPLAHLSLSEQRGVGPNTPNWANFVHLRPLVRSDAAAVAYSREDLVRETRKCLDHPETRRDRRRATVLKECGPTDGYAGRRSALFLLEALKSRAPA